MSHSENDQASESNTQAFTQSQAKASQVDTNILENSPFQNVVHPGLQGPKTDNAAYSTKKPLGRTYVSKVKATVKVENQSTTTIVEHNVYRIIPRTKGTKSFKSADHHKKEVSNIYPNFKFIQAIEKNWSEKDPTQFPMKGLYDRPLAKIQSVLENFDPSENPTFNLDGVITHAYMWLSALSWDITLCASQLDGSLSRSLPESVQYIDTNKPFNYNGDAVFIDPSVSSSRKTFFNDVLIRLIHSTGGKSIIVNSPSLDTGSLKVRDAHGSDLVSDLKDIVHAIGIQ